MDKSTTEETTSDQSSELRSHRTMQPFEPLDWVLYGLIVAGLAGAAAGWKLEDWWLGAAVAGGVYQAALLTIIALKD